MSQVRLAVRQPTRSKDKYALVSGTGLSARAHVTVLWVFEVSRPSSVVIALSRCQSVVDARALLEHARRVGSGKSANSLLRRTSDEDYCIGGCWGTIVLMIDQA